MSLLDLSGHKITSVFNIYFKQSKTMDLIKFQELLNQLSSLSDVKGQRALWTKVYEYINKASGNGKRSVSVDACIVLCMNPNRIIQYKGSTLAASSGSLLPVHFMIMCFHIGLYVCNMIEFHRI